MPRLPLSLFCRGWPWSARRGSRSCRVCCCHGAATASDDGHNSELGEMHLHRPQQVVQVGDALTVKILDVDPVQRRITLSHRQAISARRDE
ncbi:S1 RNA-binding domain-containing protein [Streptomyces anulatus]|uniref:S1 RNA-binding domain-containing protein n=1 Tax=Streptomyces anulatus TaxID=1892 RepID=UPI003830D788